MTDTDLRIAVATAKGWTLYDAEFGWWADPDGHVYKQLPNYPADPREWAELLEEIANAPNVSSVLTETAVLDDVTRHVVNIIPERPHPKIRPSHAPTLGRAVCMAWLAWKGVG